MDYISGCLATFISLHHSSRTTWQRLVPLRSKFIQGFALLVGLPKLATARKTPAARSDTHEQFSVLASQRERTTMWTAGLLQVWCQFGWVGTVQGFSIQSRKIPRKWELRSRNRNRRIISSASRNLVCLKFDDFYDNCKSTHDGSEIPALWPRAESAKVCRVIDVRRCAMRSSPPWSMTLVWNNPFFVLR